MEIEYIKIRINGSKDNVELTPDNYDIKELIFILENIENMLFPNRKSDKRPLITYKIDNGSVLHSFGTSKSDVYSFNSILGLLEKENNLNVIDNPSAISFENIQDIAIKNNYNFEIYTSISDTNRLNINKNTHYGKIEPIWVDSEFYFYGKITNAGGKDNANIHIQTDELGNIKIQTPISFLQDQDRNILYKTYGVRAKGKQHIKTGEIDKSSLLFIELLEYNPVYDEDYLDGLMNNVKNTWALKITPEEFLNDIRHNDG